VRHHAGGAEEGFKDEVAGSSVGDQAIEELTGSRLQMSVMLFICRW
jgi:hypothetical protein